MPVNRWLIVVTPAAKRGLLAAYQALASVARKQKQGRGGEQGRAHQAQKGFFFVLPIDWRCHVAVLFAFFILVPRPVRF